jgi:GTPase SAR1 family protein
MGNNQDNLIKETEKIEESIDSDDLKIVLFGPCGVGKTCKIKNSFQNQGLINYFLNKKYNDNLGATVGASFTCVT